MLPTPRRDPSDPAVARRTVLAAGGFGVVGALLSACSGTSSTATEQSPSGSPSADPTASLAPDVAVATSALAEIRQVRQAVEQTAARFPAVTGLAPVLRMHRSHEEALVDAVPERVRSQATQTPYAVPARREVALRRLATQEQTLHATLDGLALRAESGEFARLLAAMGAGVGQRLAGWPA